MTTQPTNSLVYLQKNKVVSERIADLRQGGNVDLVGREQGV